MAGSEPIFQSRNRDSRFSADDIRPFSVLNGIEQNILPKTVEIATSVETSASNNRRTLGLNRMIEFEGDLYWWQRNGIRVHVPGSGWTLGPTTNGSRGSVGMGGDVQYEEKILGMYNFVTEAGEQKLAAVWVDSSFNSRLGIRVKESKYTGDGTWSSEVALSPGTATITNAADGDGVYGYPVQDGKKLYIQFQGFENYRLYEEYAEIDLEAQTITAFTKSPIADLPGNVGSTSGNNVVPVPPTVMCSYSGITWHMYGVGGYGSALGSSRPFNQRQAIVVERVRQIIPELDLVLASGLTPNGRGSQPNQSDPDDYFQGRSDMFVVPESGRMYAFAYIWGSGLSDAAGWAVFRMRYDGASDTLINEGDIGWKVLPFPLRLSTSSTIGVRSRVKAYSLVDPSGRLTTIIEYMNDGTQGSLVNTYRWENEDTEMTLLNTGGDASWTRPLIKIGGGERVWSPRQPYNFTFRVDASGADPGKLKLRTRVLGSSEAIKVRYYFTDKKVPMQRLANISAPTSGSISANELTGITANSGEFVVDWDIQAQGFDLNDEFNIHPVAEDA
jgi:hypothetical protein